VFSFNNTNFDKGESNCSDDQSNLFLSENRILSLKGNLPLSQSVSISQKEKYRPPPSAEFVERLLRNEYLAEPFFFPIQNGMGIQQLLLLYENNPLLLELLFFNFSGLLALDLHFNRNRALELPPTPSSEMIRRIFSETLFFPYFYEPMYKEKEKLSNVIERYTGKEHSEKIVFYFKYYDELVLLDKLFDFLRNTRV